MQQGPFAACTREFIYVPRSYIELRHGNEPNGASLEVGPFDSSEQLVPIAEELRLFASDTQEEIDKWYRAIYKKILAYKAIHSNASLPFLDIQKFSEYKKFIKQKDISIPLFKQLIEWEKEARLTLEESKKQIIQASTKTKKNGKRSSKSSIKQLASTEAKGKEKEAIIEEVVEKFVPAAVLLATQSSIAEVPLFKSEPTLLEVPSVKPGPSISKKETLRKTRSKKKSISQKLSSLIESKAVEEVIPVTKSVHQMLLETSPFAVSRRVTDWFDPSAEVKIINKESRLVHDIGWAVNDVAWHLGTRYLHLNDKGKFQPAIALLCDVKHALFPKPELFLMTFTFDHTINEKTSFDPAFKYDPKWPCFHRALTRRDQHNKTVEEYMEIARNKLIDFPPLPSQIQHLKVPKEFVKTPYPDGSFIKSVSGEVITIRDPKQDTKQKKCELRLFIIQ